MDPLVKQLSKRPSILHIMSLKDEQAVTHSNGHRDMYKSDYGQNDYSSTYYNRGPSTEYADTYTSTTHAKHDYSFGSPEMTHYTYENQYDAHHQAAKVTEERALGSKTTHDIAEFCHKTTAHGWGRVIAEKLTVMKIIWVFLTIFAYICNALHISLLVEQFLDYPTEQVTRVELSSIQFPSVTICNLQPVSFSTGLAYLGNNTTNLNAWDRLTLDYLGSSATENMTSERIEYLMNRLRQPLGYFENIGDEYREIGHQPLDFVLRCTFGSKDCTAENFTYYPSSTYYNCYTFNGGNLSAGSLETRSTGPQQGLSLIMYLESDNGDMLYNGTYYTLSNVANAAGVRVTIHPPDTRPSPVDQGFDIPPGFSSSIGIRVQHYTRLGYPYGDCVSESNLGDTEYRYSSGACISACQQEFIMENCGCISANLPVPNDPRNLTYCGQFKPELPQYFFDNLSCEALELEKFAEDENMRTTCGCFSPCEELAYPNEVSYSYWPLDFAQQSFYTSYVLNNPLKESLKAYTNLQHFNLTELISQNLIRKNFLRLNVFLRNLIVENIDQKQTYEVQNLLSDMGGTFGLWIGVSILSWFEIVELLISIAYKSVCWVKRKTDAELSMRAKNVINVQPAEKSS